MNAYILTDIIVDIIKKKDTQQDDEAKTETIKDHSDGKPISETLNKTKTKIKDALDLFFVIIKYKLNS